MTEPFLKWAGGKRWLANSKQLPLPSSYERYIEPFLGGAAIFFHLKPSRAILSDVNAELIELYEVIRDNPVELMDLMKIHHAAHSPEYYYKLRESNPKDGVDRAARTMYLNRTCWNGLYRVNLSGVFNVPIGTKSTVVFDNDDFLGIADQLSNAEIRCSDFEPIVGEAREGDFVFVDPPYTVRHNLNGFIKYNENLFSWGDQVRLRDAVASAIERGAAVVVTNADHDSVRELYAGLCDYRSVKRSSVLASETTRRGPTSEALFFANL
ncbi:Dam family site-specific DNA-(adenine-N6)-methyltransferase [Mesorhizobium sp. M0621]|uniref:DNA adenine methylase n=1 Tax=Mesorhizobium sp. M0621 TaxID=2956974 RepID=UPI00333A7769